MSTLTDEELGQQAGFEVRQATIALLRDKGPTLEKILLRLRQALSAKKKIYFQKDGFVVDEREVVAHQIRLTAAKLSLELWDAMPSQKHELTGKDGKDLIITVSKDE